jgi:hypothetical protein
MEHDAQCILVIIGADDSGHKDIVGVLPPYNCAT